MSWLASRAEYFLLRDAHQTAGALDLDARTQAAELLAKSGRSILAADALAAAGQVPGALSFVAEALTDAVQGAHALADDDADLDDALRFVGVPERHRSEVGLAVRALESLPETVEESGPSHAELVVSARRQWAVVSEALAARCRAPADVERLRRFRLVGAITVAIGIGCAALWLALPPHAVWAEASGYRSDDLDRWPPDNAVDGDEMTYWHLPPDEAGWIDIHLSPPRDVTGLRILNGHDLHVDDRNRKDRRRFGHATRLGHIRAFAGDRELADAPLELELLHDFTRATIPLRADGVDRIRIEIREHYGQGGGLAVVEVLE